MNRTDEAALDAVLADLVYTEPVHGPARIRVFPPSSGREPERPRREPHQMPVYDCRPIAGELDMDVAGFELHAHATSFTDFFDSEAVRKHYYPEVAAWLKKTLGAKDVFVFDHNIRSGPRTARRESGVREPVEAAHNDYTLTSGPKRIREVLGDNGASHLADRRGAIVNVWRPIVGPVEDHPFAICDARTTRLEDFIPTEIQHYHDGNLETPAHVGEIFSFRHSPEHRWYYASSMQPDEVIVLKCYDTAEDGRARYTGHTGFRYPPDNDAVVARESIEARTVVIFDEPG